MQNRLKHIFLFLVLGVFLLPIIQSYLPIVKEKELKGYFEIQTKPILTDSDYFSGKYQELYMKYLNDNMPLKATITRINNQILFTLFKQTTVSDLKIGKNGYFYDYPYIKEFNGTQFLGSNNINGRVEALRLINNYLESINKKLIIVFAPGKASIYPSYFPEEDVLPYTDSTNYYILKRKIESAKLNFIDFRDYFVKINDTSSNTLFSKTGVHWSQYAAHKASDSLIHYMEKLGNIDIVDKKYIYNEITTKPRGEDDDIAKSMNLLWDPPTDTFTYPIVEYNSTDKVKPKVSVIADSYWWTINNIQVPWNQFSEYYFMYYYKHTYDFGKELNSEVNDDNLKHYINNSDYIILLSTEANYSWFPFGFIEHFNRLYLQN